MQKILLQIQRSLSPLLFLPAKIYAGVMRLRRRWYEKGKLESYRPQCPCISIGNISWGGSGKTPLTEWLLRWAAHNGLAAAVLTRGYGAKPPTPHFLVEADSNPQEAGDEPLLLQRACPDSLVVVDPNRARAAQWTWKNYRPHLFLLDDGFQHLGIQRDLDLVLLRPKDFTDEWNICIPSGSWREDKSALTRSSAFLIKCTRDEYRALGPLIQARLAKYKKPVFQFSFRPLGVKRVDRADFGRDFGGKPYLLITGVGEPHQVIDTAEQLLGQRPALHLRFEDHHNYSQADWDRIHQQAERRGVEHILCTAKDAVKLARLETQNLWTFEHTLDFSESTFTELDFPDWWKQSWNSLVGKEDDIQPQER